MKRNQIILLVVFFLVSALIYWQVLSNKKPRNKEGKEPQTTAYIPIAIVKNQERTLKITSYGQIAPYSEVDVSFEVQGKLEKGEMALKVGSKFRFNQVLYKVNSEEAYYSLNARKAQLSNLIIGALPDIELDFASEKNKWMNFMNEINPASTLPEFPRFSNNKEKMFITAKGILGEYMSIKSQESRMAKYIFLAPFDGTVVEIFAEPGAVANPGARIARIAKTGEMEVKVPISLTQLKLYQQLGAAQFTDSKGNVVGKGSIVRTSDIINQKTQSVDVYYSIQAENGEKLFAGQFVNVLINQSSTQRSFTVPTMAVRDNEVFVLNGKQVNKRAVMVIGSKPDSLFVSGLNDGEKVVLEQVEPNQQIKSYVGIKRN